VHHKKNWIDKAEGAAGAVGDVAINIAKSKVI
jgi:NADPH-dependent curcumin reductase CurA